MIDIDDLYYEWLLTCLDPDGAVEGVAYLGDLLHDLPFKRRVGHDINRASDGANLRKEFLAQFADANFDPHVTNELMARECSWFEMLVALSKALDYLYEGGVEGRFIELITNLGLDSILDVVPKRSKAVQKFDVHTVEIATSIVDSNMFDSDGHGGLFPLFKSDHEDQRGVEIWDQHAAYFRERLEGVMWTSTR